MVGKRVLMVEGPDDEHVVKHICGERQLGQIETIHPYQLPKSLSNSTYSKDNPCIRI